MKFDFSKSTEADFRNKLQTDLHILMKNILYITHQQDKILAIVTSLHSDDKLQTQVTDYYDLKETSPQTESDEQ